MPMYAEVRAYLSQLTPEQLQADIARSETFAATLAEPGYRSRNHPVQVENNTARLAIARQILAGE